MQELFKLHSINPELTEKLCFEYTPDKRFKYNFINIKSMVIANQTSKELLPIAEEQPLFTMNALSIVRNDRSKHYGIEDIKKLAEINKKMPKFLNILMHQKDEQENPRFNADQIENVIDLYYKEPDLVNELVYSKVKDRFYRTTRYKFSADCIDKIAKTYQENDQNKIKLLKKMLKGDHDAFFSGEYNDLDTSSNAIMHNLNLYDLKKEILDKVNNDNTVSEEFQDYFHKKFGKTGLEIIQNLAKLNLSFKEIQRILYLTETLINKKDILKSPWKNNIVIQNDNYTISEAFGYFIDKD